MFETKKKTLLWFGPRGAKHIWQKRDEDEEENNQGLKLYVEPALFEAVGERKVSWAADTQEGLYKCLNLKF